GCTPTGIASGCRSPVPAPATRAAPPTIGSAPRWRWALRSSLVVAFWVLPSLAHAFADSSQFFVQKTNPHAATFGASAEGVYFTGAPRFASLNCQSCHAGGPGLVGLRLGASDPAL